MTFVNSNTLKKLRKYKDFYIIEINNYRIQKNKHFQKLFLESVNNFTINGHCLF